MKQPNVRRGLWLLVLGAVLIVAFRVFASAEILGLGKPPDTGGGLLPTAGLLCMVIGLGLVANGLMDRGSRK